MNTVRPERTIEQYSRGAELHRSILAMWQANADTPYVQDRTAIINRRIDNLMADFDLTFDEWYYWSRLCAKREA
jgi:hypothetical protein